MPRVRFVKQVAPAVGDLTGRCAQMAPQAVDYPTGAWGTESRDYHLCVDVEPGRIGQEMLAARVSLILNTASGRRALGQGLIRAIWTEDEALSTRMSRHVARQGVTRTDRMGPKSRGRRTDVSVPGDYLNDLAF